MRGTLLLLCPLLMGLSLFSDSSARTPDPAGEEKGLSSEAWVAAAAVDGQLSAYPDLIDFLKDNHLFSRMQRHGHRIAFAADGSPCLLVEGELRSWEQVRREIPTERERFKEQCTYTCKGIVFPSSREGIHLYTTVRGEGRASVEVVSRLLSPPHTWLRVISSSGEVYSAGFFSDQPIVSWWQMARALYPRRGEIHSPDPYETIDPPELTISTAFAIEEEGFDYLLKRLGELQSDCSLSFQLVNLGWGENCTGFVVGLLREVGIYLPDSSWASIENPYALRNWQITQKGRNDGSEKAN